MHRPSRPKHQHLDSHVHTYSFTPVKSHIQMAPTTLLQTFPTVSPSDHFLTLNGTKSLHRLWCEMRGSRRPLILCFTVCWKGRIWSRRMAYLDKQRSLSCFYMIQTRIHTTKMYPHPPAASFSKDPFLLFSLPRPALQLLHQCHRLPFFSQPAFKLVCLPIFASHIIFIEGNPKWNAC